MKMSSFLVGRNLTAPWVPFLISFEEGGKEGGMISKARGQGAQCSGKPSPPVLVLVVNLLREIDLHFPLGLSPPLPTLQF